MSIFQNSWLSLFIFPLLGYLSGSLSFALWVTRLVKGVDVREAGSKHATATNTVRQAGWGPGVLVLVLDIAKGFVPVYLASRLGAADWVVALTGALAVVGHCWPLFAGFRGGMGLATGGGGFLAVAPLAFAIGLGVLVSLLLIIRHSARASVFAGLLFTPVFWLFGLRGQILWLSTLVGLVIARRFTMDWRRQYRELWLDRNV
ncbi:MAG: glycerol-3-phosphate acyltransferase [Anaerolineales bacterium]